MPNSSYDVDEILKEVRKRRIENEEVVKANTSGGVTAQADFEAEAKAKESKKTEAAPEKADIAENGKDTENQPISNQKSTKTVSNENASEQKSESDLKPEKEQPKAPEKAENTVIKAAQSVQAIDVPLDEPLVNTANQNNAGEIDILKFAPTQEAKSSKKAEKKGKKKKSKKAKIIICIIMVLVIAIAGVAGGMYIYLNRALDEATDNSSQKTETINEWSGMDVLTEQFDTIYEDGRGDITSYKNMVKTWYYNGKPASSTHVLNVLLIGEDTRDEEIAEEGTRADSAIIASINVDTKKITLTSILRDAYCYYEVKEGDSSTGKFGKINEAMSVGGVDCYIRCIENTYKLNIDNYVIVNFNSFEKIIDKLGGVTVELTKAEINEVNNHQKRYNHVTIDAEPGLVDLDGAQALAYCRIRKIDSDNARADRQKTVLLQVFEKMKGASTVKALEIANSLLPYVKTGFSKTEIVDISSYALKHGWLSFQTSTQTVPENSTDENGSVITTCKGGTFSGVWLWKVDYPLSAQLMQQEIYGKTNIVLAEKRPNFSEISFSL